MSKHLPLTKYCIGRRTLEKKLITATKHKKTKSAIVLKNGYIVLSSISPSTLANRFAGKVNAVKYSDTIEEYNEDFEDISNLDDNL